MYNDCAQKEHFILNSDSSRWSLMEKVKIKQFKGRGNRERVPTEMAEIISEK